MGSDIGRDARITRVPLKRPTRRSPTNDESALGSDFLAMKAHFLRSMVPRSRIPYVGTTCVAVGCTKMRACRDDAPKGRADFDLVLFRAY